MVNNRELQSSTGGSTIAEHWGRSLLTLKGENMPRNTLTPAVTEAEPVLRDCVETLRQVADYRLPKAMDQRLLWLSENKEKLSGTEREELLALAEFAEQRTLEKV